MSDEDDGIVQNNCCQRKFCEYFFCCWRNCAKFFVVEGIVQDLVTESIVQILVREEGQRMHLLISVFLGSLNVGKLEIVHSFLSFFLFPPAENQKKSRNNWRE